MYKTLAEQKEFPKAMISPRNHCSPKLECVRAYGNADGNGAYCWKRALCYDGFNGVKIHKILRCYPSFPLVEGMG